MDGSWHKRSNWRIDGRPENKAKEHKNGIFCCVRCDYVTMYLFIQLYEASYCIYSHD